MNLITHLDINNIFIVGDIHGQFKQLFHKIKNGVSNTCGINTEGLVNEKILKECEPFLQEMDKSLAATFYDISYNYQSSHKDFNNSIIIVAGDCGFGFEKEEYYIQTFNKYKNLLEKNNIFLYFIRGNHDDPSYFSENKINFSNIKTIPDYSIIQTKNGNILCVGGAISIDRTWRKEEEIRINKYKKNHFKKRYWEDEKPIFNKDILDEISKENIHIDYVVTHTSPTIAFPTYKGGIREWSRVDKSLTADTRDERQTLMHIFNYLKENGHNVKEWIYGHFHSSNREVISNTLFVALNDNMQFRSIVHDEQDTMTINPIIIRDYTPF